MYTYWNTLWTGILLCVLTIFPNSTEVLSPVIASSSTIEDVLAEPLKTSPYLFAIGSISLSIIALLFGLRWLDYRDGRTSSKGAHFTSHLLCCLWLF